MACDEVRAGAQNFLGVVHPDVLRGGGAETQSVDDGARIPWLSHTVAVNIAYAHIGHHLRWRDRDVAGLAGVYAMAGQPVVKPHGMCARGEGVCEGVLAWVASDFPGQ